ncbi:ParB N-terminal domain-containing protein [Georgenia sp. AZ-5]|uniref:ParB N-terminal domain-containing protein n=1 Tax=Georgenia sp. AZ-5 TaxID=3367526 RepID=UPI0037546BC4
MSEVREYRGAERSVDSIVVGARHRTDLGDLTPLMESIQRVGLLQPITVTPDGLLVCGARRLEALKRLGVKTVNVWVRAGISDKLSSLLAQQDENALRKPLSPIEAAELYRELKALLAEDAQRRIAANQFRPMGGNGGTSGRGDSPRPERGPGRTREEAADFVTGSASYKRLEQINKLRAMIGDETRPLTIRRLAEAKLDAIAAGAPVAPAYESVMQAIATAEREPNPLTPEQIAQLGVAALERAKKERPARVQPLKAHQAPPAPVKRSPKALVLTWRDLDGWTRHYDADQVAAELSDADWGLFERVVSESVGFLEAVGAARQARTGVA